MNNLNNILVADFETITKETDYYKEHGETRVIYWGIMSITEKNYRVGTTMESFFDYINNLPVLTDAKNKTIPYQIYFHNLTFDGAFIYEYLKERDPEHLHFEALTKGRTFYSLTYTGPNYKIIFKDSIKFLVMSVNVLAQTLLNSTDPKQRKGIINKRAYEDSLTPEEIEGFYHQEPKEKPTDFWKPYQDYVKNDVLVVTRHLRNLYTLIFNDFGKNIFDFYTSGSVMLAIHMDNAETYFKNYRDPYSGRGYKHNRTFNKKKLFSLTLPRTLSDELRPLFKGGLTRENEKYAGPLQKTNETQKVHYIDINSSYPDSMRGDLPHGEPYRVKGVTLDQAQTTENFDYFIKIRWNYPVEPRYPHVDFFMEKPVQGGISYFWVEEFRELQTLYFPFDFELLELWRTPKHPYLKNSFEGEKGFYHLKQEASDPALKLIYKIFLNSGYGKFAETPHDEELLPMDLALDASLLEGEEPAVKVTYKGNIATQIDWVKPVTKAQKTRAKQREDNDLEPLEFYKRKTYLRPSILDPDFGIYSVETYSTPKERESHIVVASYITMKSRMKLIKMIKRIGLDNFFYCDTDSIFFKDDANDTIVKDIEAAGLIHPSNLGAWSFEQKDIVEASFLGKKKYYYVTKDQITNEQNFVIKAAGIWSQKIKSYVNPKMFIDNLSSGVVTGGHFKKEYVKGGIVFDQGDKIIHDVKVIERATAAEDSEFVG